MRVEINYRKKNGKNTITWRLNNILMKNQWVKEEINEEIRKYLEINENKKHLSKIHGMQQKQF